ESCHGDIRLVINTLQFLSSQASTITYAQMTGAVSDQVKDVDLGAFDVIREFFNRPQNVQWIQERTNYYFVDQSIVPLMVQDKYASVDIPANSPNMLSCLNLLSE